MKRNSVLGFVLLLVLLLPACATSKLTASWADPTFKRLQVRSILVMGVSGEDLLRRTFEDEMVAQLRQYGVRAVPSYRSVSGREIPKKDELEEWVGSQDVDGVMVSRLVGTHQEAVVYPGYTSRFGYGGPYWGSQPWVDPYHGWYGYYSGSYDLIHYPPEVSYYEVYTIETTLYLVDSDQPVWSARAEISSRKDMNEAVEELVTDLVDNMVDKGVI